MDIFSPEKQYRGKFVIFHFNVLTIDLKFLSLFCITKQFTNHQKEMRKFPPFNIIHPCSSKEQKLSTDGLVGWLVAWSRVSDIIHFLWQALYLIGNGELLINTNCGWRSQRRSLFRGWSYSSEYRPKHSILTMLVQERRC